MNDTNDKTYIVRTTRLTVLPQGEPMFDERATDVHIMDEAGGEFICLHQDSEDAAPGEIRIDPEEWPAIKQAVEAMLAQIVLHAPKPIQAYDNPDTCSR